MNLGWVDLAFLVGVAVLFLLPLVMGYLGFGRPGQHRPLLKKSLIGIASLQLAGLIYSGWLFGTSTRHVNHLKWIAPLVFVYVLMWICFGVGFGVAALRYRIRNRT